MKRREKLYIALFLLLIATLVAALLIFGLKSGPKKDEQGRTLIGIDDPDYDPEEDPNNPFNEDYTDDEGNYYYENKDLGFSIKLPPEFIYFQTQRWDNSSFSDLEILVPTKDPEYTRATPPSYAKPVVVRIWRDMGDWQQENQDDYTIFGEKNGKVYTIKFWEQPSRDWVDKWSDQMESEIVQSVEFTK